VLGTLSKKQDIWKIPQADLDYRYPKYHIFSNRFIFAGELEKFEITLFYGIVY